MAITKDKQRQNRTERPTLKTIAELCGLAVPTVSRALSDAPDIGSATKEKVRRIAGEIGYSPNRAGQRLRTGKTNVIALVLSTSDDTMNHTARLITSIAAATRDTPYHMIVTPYFPNQDPLEPVLYITETGSADGLILNQTQPEDPRVAHMMEIGFPFATHGRTNWADKHPYFDMDNGVFGAMAVRRLVEKGRRTILLVAPRMEQMYAIEMTEGAMAEAKRLGAEIVVLPGATSDDESPIVAKATAAYVERNPEIDGIITASTNAAIAAVAGLETLGRLVGREYDLASKEALPLLKSFRKDIQVVSEDVTLAGDFVCRALMQAIDKPDAAPMQFLDKPTEIF